MVIIRLFRMGNRNQPFFRIVAVDSRDRKGANYLDVLGTYDPKKNPPEVSLKMEEISEWQKKGARMSQTVASLVKRYGNERVD